MKKLFFSCIFSLLAISTGFCQKVAVINDIKYCLEDGEATIMVQTNPLPLDIVIPSELTYKGAKYKVTALTNEAFRGYSELKSIVLPEGITEIPDRCFASCYNLTSITLPNSLTSLGKTCFVRCGFSSIKLPDGLKSIGSHCFWSCRNLTSITIPATVTFMDEACFFRCSSLMKVKCKWANLDNVDCNESAFNAIFPQAKLYVPNGTSSKYKSKSPWSNFNRIIEEDGASTTSTTTGNNM